MPHIHCETCACLSASWWRPGLCPWQGSWTGRKSLLRQPPGRRRTGCPRRGSLRGTEGSSGESPAEPPLGDTREVDGCPSLLHWVKFPYIDNQLITPSVLSGWPPLLDKTPTAVSPFVPLNIILAVSFLYSLITVGTTQMWQLIL